MSYRDIEPPISFQKLIIIVENLSQLLTGNSLSILVPIALPGYRIHKSLPNGLATPAQRPESVWVNLFWEFEFPFTFSHKIIANGCT